MAALISLLVIPTSLSSPCWYLFSLLIQGEIFLILGMTVGLFVLDIWVRPWTLFQSVLADRRLWHHTGGPSGGTSIASLLPGGGEGSGSPLSLL